MKRFRVIKTEPDNKHFKRVPSLLYEQGSQRFQYGNDPADTHLKGCYVLLNDQRPIGRFALYHNPHLKFKGQQAACIGSYECIADLKASEHILAKAIQLSRKNKCKYLIGPMEGSTWNNYRFSSHNQHPNFIMEPYHHIYYNDQFLKAGFEPIAEYFSHLSQELTFDKHLIENTEQSYKKEGYEMRNFDVENPIEELERVARFCIREFSGNFLYTPIDPSEFVVKYKQYIPLFQPDLIQILEDSSGEIEALIFAVQDHFNNPKKTIVIKSLVRRKDSEFKGIGAYLVGKIHEISIKHGYEEIIHAMMLKENTSLNTSKRFKGAPYKSYNLYAYKL